jgi:hypothetical protein
VKPNERDLFYKDERLSFRHLKASSGQVEQYARVRLSSCSQGSSTATVTVAKWTGVRAAAADRLTAPSPEGCHHHHHHHNRHDNHQISHSSRHDSKAQGLL